MKTHSKVLISLFSAHILLLLLFAICVSCSKNDNEATVIANEVEEVISKPKEEPKEPPFVFRELPEGFKFKKGSHCPLECEGEVSGAISNSLFSAGRDLVYVDDERVWWESDHDGETDNEDDHSMHKNLEKPFRQLVELLAKSNATLRVQEAYRPAGTHATKSLHKEGRALDLTCPELDPASESYEPDDTTMYRPPSQLSLEILANLCWGAGFDWVYYEVPKGTGNGAHIHVSVRADTQEANEQKSR